MNRVESAGRAGRPLLMEIGEDGLAALQRLASLPVWPEGTSEAGSLELLREEMMIRNEFLAYGYAYDIQDLDTVLSYFADDCVITNPRGQVVGAQAIRENYLVLFGSWKLTRHLWNNVTVRFLDATPTEACVGAYHHANLIAHDRALTDTGVNIRRLKRADGAWKIAQRWITDDIDYAITPIEGPVDDPEKVEQLRREARS
jgi:SnoaL-like protein